MTPVQAYTYNLCRCADIALTKQDKQSKEAESFEHSITNALSSLAN